VFNPRGQAQKVYVGTDDTGATDSDPTGGGATGNNMVLISENEFDNRKLVWGLSLQRLLHFVMQQ
jgi:hypothetical protein